MCFDIIISWIICISNAACTNNNHIIFFNNFVRGAQRIVYIYNTHTLWHVPNTPHTHTHTHTYLTYLTERGDTVPLRWLHSRPQAHLQVYQDFVPCCTTDCRMWYHYSGENTRVCNRYSMRPSVFMKYTGTSTRVSCHVHVYCIKHEDFSCYNVFYITMTPYLPCNNN